MNNFKHNDYKYIKRNCNVDVKETVKVANITDPFENLQVNCKATIDGKEKRWNFTLVQPSVVVGPGVADGSDEAWKTPEFKTPAWPSGVSADKTVEEFKQYIAADIA